MARDTLIPLDTTDYWDAGIRRSASRFFLLAALAERPMHGYELAQAVEAASGACCSPSDAALYPALRELSEGGYIECETEMQGRRGRNVCRLTDRGREALAAAGHAWGRVLPFIQTVVDAAPPLSIAACDCCE
ncbi:MAG: PadR family transcriptional regulator [Chloroflexi bacterium]|nr:PadR family transcriptional regulator [Chloroflexota bacterium]